MALVVAIGAAGCGSDGDDGEGGAAASSGNATQASSGGSNGAEDQVRATYDELVAAMYAGDGAKACSLMTEKVQKGYGKQEGTTCQKRVKSDSRKLSKVRPKVGSVRVQGARAVARAGGANTLKYAVPFVKQGDEWKVAGGF